MRRRLVVAKAERIDTQQLELYASSPVRHQAAGVGSPRSCLPGTGDADDDPDANSRGKTLASKKRRTCAVTSRSAQGAHRVHRSGARGTAQRIGTEDSYKLMRRRADYIGLGMHRSARAYSRGPSSLI